MVWTKIKIDGHTDLHVYNEGKLSGVRSSYQSNISALEIYIYTKLITKLQYAVLKPYSNTRVTEILRNLNHHT